MSVTEYLNRARECADLADRMEGEFRQKLLEVAQEWLKRAEEVAQATAQTESAHSDITAQRPVRP